MIRTQTSLVLKYCQSADQFVRVRRFGLQEMDNLLSGARVHDRRSYIELVINACVLDMEALLLGLPSERRMALLNGVREELYRLAVEVNPELEITRVAVPVDTEGAPELALLKSPSRSSEPGPPHVADLENTLKRRIIGQDNAVRVVAQAMLRARAGIRDETRPVGTFLFVGPTGVGKTELAKVLADAVYGGNDHLLRIDCSEYSMSHEYAKLIGAPPGYVGHENGGYLTESMLKMKEGVVLFDEVEKAHEKVYNLLLQIMDEGIVTDGKGVKVDFTGSVIIMTSNLGVKEVRAILRRAGFGRPRDEGEETTDERKKASLDAVKEYFSPEFVNRVDEVVVFDPIERDVAERIFDLVLNDFARRLARRGYAIELSPALRRDLLSEGVNRRYGARPLKRVIRRRLEAPIAEAILGRRDVKGKRIWASLGREGTVRLSFRGGGRGSA